MPLCHANSLYFATTFIHIGATCIVDDSRSFDPEALLATLSREHVTARTVKAIAGSQLCLIKNAPHGFNLSHAEEFNNALLEFVRA